MRVDPIEAESLYHFHPGARVLRPASLSPSSVVTEARKAGAQCVSMPAEPGPHVLEVQNTARICRQKGLLAVGGITGQAASEGRGVDLGTLDAATIDLTGAMHSSRFRLTLDRLRKVLLDRATTWIELVVRVVPGQTGSDRLIDETSREIAAAFGPDVPVHIEGLVGELEALRQARWIAISNGLHWVYMDAAADASGRSSWCPGCDALLVARGGAPTSRPGLTGALCSSCLWCMPGRFVKAGAELPARGMHSSATTEVTDADAGASQVRSRQDPGAPRRGHEAARRDPIEDPPGGAGRA